MSGADGGTEVSLGRNAIVISPPWSIGPPQAAARCRLCPIGGPVAIPVVFTASFAASNCVPPGLHQRDAVDFDVERPGPFRDTDKDARRRIFGEIARVDRVDGREMFGRGAVDVALHHILQAGARGLQAQFQLLMISSVWRSIGTGRISPVAGSNGG